MDTFNVKFTIFYNKFQQYTAAKRFIDEKLILNKEKTVTFFTKHVFTAGHTSSQRFESLNSFFKGFGSMKRERTTLNIYELITWLDKCVERIYTQFLLKFVMALTRQFLPVDIGISGLINFGTTIVNMQSIYILVLN